MDGTAKVEKKLLFLCLIMKKFIVVVFALMLLAGGRAYAQWSLGAGYVHASLVSRYAGGETYDKTAFNGLYAGIGYVLPVTRGLDFTPGVYYEYIACGEKTEGRTLDFLGETREHYLNVPLTLQLGADLSPDVRLVLFAGPTFRLGLDSITSYSLGWSVHEFEVLKGGINHHNFRGDDYSRFDLLLGGGIALEVLSRFRLQLGYDAGLLNRYTGEPDDLRMHARRLSAGIAYLF